MTYSWLSGQRDPVDRLFAPVRDRWHIAYQVEDADFILELVAQGFGISVLLDTPPVHRPDVKRLALTSPVSASNFYIVRRKPPPSPGQRGPVLRLLHPPLHPPEQHPGGGMIPEKNAPAGKRWLPDGGVLRLLRNGEAYSLA